MSPREFGFLYGFIWVEGLMPRQNKVKEDFEETINTLMQPADIITVALDHTGEIVAFDEFIDGYRSLYEELGNFEVFKIHNPGLSYRKILRLEKRKATIAYTIVQSMTYPYTWQALPEKVCSIAAPT